MSTMSLRVVLRMSHKIIEITIHGPHFLESKQNWAFLNSILVGDNQRAVVRVAAREGRAV